MFTLLFYSGVCAVVSGILTVLSTLFRPIHKKGDSNPWVPMVGFFLVAFGAPYIYTESLTKLYGSKMKSVIQEVYEGADIQGPMRFYRVIGYRPDKEATAIVVGSEKESWGGTSRPVLSVHLVMEKGCWKVDSYKMVSSERLNKDGYTFPPYW